jgi:hypothetical protein
MKHQISSPAKLTFSAGSVNNPAPQPTYSCGVVLYDESNEATPETTARKECYRALRGGHPVKRLQLAALVNAEGIGGVPPSRRKTCAVCAMLELLTASRISTRDEGRTEERRLFTGTYFARILALAAGVCLVR